jgi:FkbM family methyltransferase
VPRLLKLLSIGRLKRCREIFSDSLAAHRALSRRGSAKKPARFNFKRGGEVEFPSRRDWQKTLEYLITGPRSLMPVEVDNGLLTFGCEGRRLTMRTSSNDAVVFSEIYLDDVYDFARLPEKLGVVIDLGTHIGMFTTRISPRAQRVISVEASSANLEMARRNIRQAGIEGKVTLLHNAAGRNSGEKLRLFLSTTNTGGNSLQPRHSELLEGAQFEDVPSLSLADLFAQQKIEQCDLLKCDIEGGEYDVFAGAPDELFSHIARITLEAHLSGNAANEQAYEALAERLRKLGYKVNAESARNSAGQLKEIVYLSATR